MSRPERPRKARARKGGEDPPVIRLRYRASFDHPRAAAAWRSIRAAATGGAPPTDGPKRGSAKKGGTAPSLEIELHVAPDRWRTTTRLGGEEVSLFVDARGGGTIVVHGRDRAARVERPDRARRRPKRAALEWKPDGRTIESPVGPATSGSGRLRIGREVLGLRMVLADGKTLPVGAAAIAHALFPPPFWGDGLARDVAGLGGIPVQIELFDPARPESAAATLELDSVDVPRDGARIVMPPDLPRPGGGSATGGFDIARHAFGGGPGTFGLDEDDLSVLVDAVNLLLGAPVDAGLAFAASFYRKAAAFGSAAARLVLPLESRRLRFDIDWFGAYFDRLVEAGFDPEFLDEHLALFIGLVLTRQVRDADSIEDLADLTEVLTEDEVAELEAVLDADETWLDFATAERRDEIALAFLREVLAAPLAVDLRPEPDFSDRLEGTAIEGATATFNAASGEVVIRNVFGVLHLHLSRLRLTARAGDPAVHAEGIDTEAARIDADVDFFQLTFDFWTEPSAEIWMIIVRIVTLGITDAALWNAGVGDFSLGPSSFQGRLVPERSGRTRLRTRWRPNSTFCSVDTNFVAIGWNPLQDIALLLASAAISWFNLFVDDVVAAIDAGVNAGLDAGRILEFPRMFLCGGPFPSGEDGADAATRVLARPRSADPVVTADRSVYYRGIYDYMGAGTVDDRPFDPNLPRDGAYVVHRRVFDAMIARRSGLDGRRTGLGVAPPDGMTNDVVFPDAIREAAVFDAELLDAIGDAGLMTADEVERWQELLEWVRPWLSFQGFPGAEIPLAGVVGLPRVYYGVAPRVEWGDGLDGVAFDSPVAVARIAVTGTHTMDLDFIAEDGRGVYQLLRDLYAEIDPLLLPELRVRPPRRLGGVPILDAVVNRQMLLSVGLWSQDGPLPPPLPPPFEFSLDSLAALDDGPVTHHTDLDAFRDAGRAEAVRARTAQEADALLGQMTRTLNSRALYLDLRVLESDLPAGLTWAVTLDDPDTGEERLMVRTIGDRLYLDFELDPVAIRDLGWQDLL